MNISIIVKDTLAINNFIDSFIKAHINYYLMIVNWNCLTKYLSYTNWLKYLIKVLLASFLSSSVVYICVMTIPITYFSFFLLSAIYIEIKIKWVTYLLNDNDIICCGCFWSSWFLLRYIFYWKIRVSFQYFLKKQDNEVFFY